MTIDSRTLYATLLGLKAPWGITDVEMKQPPGEVHIRVALPADTLWVCPQCSSAAPIHDHQERHWRHLDTCQFPTIVHARVPRLKCPTHGIEQLPVPWAEVGSRFTAMFEALAISWLGHASIKAVAAQFRLSWAEVDGILQRAVRRGLARRKLEAPRHVGVDETSFQQRHEYVTVVRDLSRGRRPQLPAVVPMGPQQPARTDAQGGGHDQAPLGEHPHLLHARQACARTRFAPCAHSSRRPPEIRSHVGAQRLPAATGCQPTRDRTIEHAHIDTPERPCWPWRSTAT